MTQTQGFSAKPRHYSGNTLITDTANNWWYWALVWTNEKASWTTPPSAVYTIKGRTLQWASTHEIGHAPGLDHNGTSVTNQYCCGKYLMYYSPYAYWENGVYKPTSDEIDGVRKIYGTLY